MRVWYTWSDVCLKPGVAVTWFRLQGAHKVAFEGRGDTWLAHAPRVWLAEVERLTGFVLLGVEE